MRSMQLYNSLAQNNLGQSRLPQNRKQAYPPYLNPSQNKKSPIHFSGRSALKKLTLSTLALIGSIGLAPFIAEKINPDWGFILMPPEQNPIKNFQPTVETIQRIQAQVTELNNIPREVGNPKQLDNAARYIKEQWESLGLNVSEQTFLLDGKTYRNLSVSFEASKTGIENSEERVIIGAHYDTVKNSPGADDNASGVVGLFELARKLKKQNPQLKHPVDLVAYTMEEMHMDDSGHWLGARGSQVHADSLKGHNIPVKGMISLEMIGSFSKKAGSQKYPLPQLNKLYPDSANFIAVLGYKKGKEWIEQVSQAFKESGTIDTSPMYIPFKSKYLPLHRSDHSSYVSNNFPALMLTDTAEFRNHTYHTEKDTPEKINYPEMAKVIQGVFHLLKTL